MKKVFFAAAAMLLMVVATSCEEGKCACVGTSATEDIRMFNQQGGYSDKMVCDDLESTIKSKYTNPVYSCYPGKTADDFK